jgi:hypothetical protein
MMMTKNKPPLEIHEILDRFELLYPHKSELSDLRRTYIDKDLSSVFRIVTDENKENLRKLIMEDNIYKLWTLLNSYTDTRFVGAFKNFFIDGIEIDKDCFSRGQLQSKLWLVDELKKCDVELGTVFLCAGWYATLATMIFESGIVVDKIRSFDIDPSCEPIAKIFNKPWLIQDWKFQVATEDIHDIDFNIHTYKVTRADETNEELNDSPDTIINTSCEHIENFEEWYAKIPDGKLVILQSNNFFEVEEHINCSKTLADFSKSAPMKKTLYSGEIELEKYTRFMCIGIK